MAESKFPSRAKLALSGFLIFLGVALYVGWGIAYGSWNFFEPKFIPVYGLVVVLIGFGVLGYLLVRTEESES
jgi:hypothetical protein